MAELDDGEQIIPLCPSVPSLQFNPFVLYKPNTKLAGAPNERNLYSYGSPLIFRPLFSDSNSNTKKVIFRRGVTFS